MIFEDDETLRMYVDESLEHLADIENDLLAIEESGKDIDDELVNNVFRAAHSIKGGAGFMGLSTIKDLSHHLENVLGLIRTNELIPQPETISVLLLAFDRLRELINNVETSNESNVQEHVEALIKLTTDTLPEDEKESVSNSVFISHPDSQTIFEAPQFDIDQAVKQGKFIYLIEFDLIHDIHRKDKTPIDVMTSLLNSGIIIDSKVDFLAVGTLDTELPNKIPFLVLFATIIEPSMITTLVDLADDSIYTINQDMIYDTPPEKTPGTPVDQPIEPTIPVEEVEEIVQETPAPVTPQVETPEPVFEPEPQTETVEAGTQAAVAESKQPKTQQTSLRVNVDLLDTLMTLAGELVLSRNQLLQGISATNTRAMEASSQRIDMITSELQEAIMRTRMQPISNVFNKFTRVVRDLAKDLGKQIDLTMEGKEVELDKTIIEAINDPLTHLVRNSVDHGIEDPDTRLTNGKPVIGKIRLKAFHEAGQVNIEISDDGKGLNGDAIAASAIKKGLISEQNASSLSDNEKIDLIFLPGFSTAKEITDVSGRGVGMDVVKTNLDKLGGIIDISSQVGKGTTILIKLPLTLAIIPSQIISVGNERYAIPQVNLDELLRIPAAQVKHRIEKVGDAEVVRLRGMLLPLLNLSGVLGINKKYLDPDSENEFVDRRKAIVDRRSNPENADIDEEFKSQRSGKDRRYHASSAINIAVVSAGAYKYGLVVDKLMDSEEIVVKPLGRHLKDCEGYAGATIMGDGRVALILDVASLARMANLSTLEGTNKAAQLAGDELDKEEALKDRASLLLFRNAPDEQFAAPLSLVERIERVQNSDIELVGGKKVIQYRGGTLPLFELSEVADIKPLPERDQLEVIVFRVANREVGLMVTPPVDAVEVALNIDATTLKQTGIMGSVIIGDHTTLMVDIFEVVKTINPEWFDDQDAATQLNLSHEDAGKILFAEDSAFFRNQVTGFLEEEGFNIITAEDGAIAWELLQELSDEIILVLTDLEMPNMSGFELTEKVKNDDRFSHLPVIALTSLAGEEDIARGKSVGIDSYQIKLDREQLVDVVKDHLKKKRR